MALLTCPDCGAPVSDFAASCPRCGRPLVHGADDKLAQAVTAETASARRPASSRGARTRALAGAALVLVGAGAGLAYRGTRRPPAPAPLPLAALPAPGTSPSVAELVAGLPTNEKGRPPRAICKDSAYWYGRRKAGTCSGHGGVARWLDGQQHQTGASPTVGR